MCILRIADASFTTQPARIARNGDRVLALAGTVTGLHNAAVCGTRLGVYSSMHSPRLITSLLALALAVLRGPSATAQPVLAVPVEPSAVTNESGEPMEGWAVLRYTVRADGSATDVRVVDALPPRLPAAPFIEAVQQWQFAPAVGAAATIDWHNNESTVLIDNESIPAEPSTVFSQTYLEIDALVAEGRLEEAARRNERLVADVALRLPELSLAQTQAAQIHLARSDPHAAYIAIVRATDPRTTTLSEAQLEVALQYRFVIETRLGRVVEALATYARIEALGADMARDEIARQAAALRAALDGDRPVAIRARVDDRPWRHTPSRRTFTLADVDGNVRALALECDRRAMQLEYTDDVEWSLPESWGECVLFVDARRGTTFTLYEFN